MCYWLLRIPIPTKFWCSERRYKGICVHKSLIYPVMGAEYTGVYFPTSLPPSLSLALRPSVSQVTRFVISVPVRFRYGIIVDSLFPDFNKGFVNCCLWPSFDSGFIRTIFKFHEFGGYKIYLIAYYLLFSVSTAYFYFDSPCIESSYLDGRFQVNTV